MRTLTVFTPTYNRSYCLGQLYESLKRQKNDDFEWLIIDDGSTDNTEELVQGWLAEAQISMTYIKQENQGMHGAHNTAYENIRTELNVCMDSDDYMPHDAIDKIISFWKTHGSNKVSGFVALDAYTDGRIIGTRLPDKLEASTLFDLYAKHGVTGDKKLVYRTELAKLYPYPLFQGERYVGLAYKYYKLDEHYPLLLCNEVLCIVEYMEDGSSRNMLRQYRINPRGFAFYRKSLMELSLASAGFKYRQAVHYISSSLFSRNRNWFKESPKKGLTLLAIVPGLLLHLFIVSRMNRLNKQRGTANDYSVG
ncbi:glycosyltransferase family 2 protein [Paenibacillus sp. HB172176]|uniref:glycosyltransferase family 2 protein n=1 Tax=Paenibacillus sp. HB172176 TaxID=2493690 RepID=UPI001439A913|nr:glycosyltransferase family 2 protein [Paenibacillus sp. HB172176]